MKTTKKYKLPQGKNLAKQVPSFNEGLISHQFKEEKKAYFKT